MKTAILSGAVVVAWGLGLAAAPALAQAPGSAAVDEIAGWAEFADAVRALPSQMLEALPPEARADPQVRQEVGRLALEALATTAIDAIAGDGDHPVFLPTAGGAVLNVGQPNADTIYRAARITPGGVYRLRGRRGSSLIVKIAEAGPLLGEDGAGPKQVGAFGPYHDLNALHADRDGRFEAVLSRVRPEGYAGDWWPLQPTTSRLILRIVSSDWAKEESPTLSIERLDTPVTRPRPTRADLERRLHRLSGAVSAWALMLIDHVDKLRREGHVNSLKVFDTSQLGALEGQFYYEGAYQLGDDEALLVEATVPAHCRYRSMLLTNALYETTDWYNNQSSLNDAQAAPDPDGVLRIVVSAKDPGVPNWLDTAGYPVGVVQGRWTNCDSTPIPTARKVALADLRKLLPLSTAQVSPEQRQQIIRERRAAMQQRPLW